MQVRVGDNNPWSAYQRLVGLGPSGGTDVAAARTLLAHRKSVNDLVRAQLRDLLARKDLSQADRQRLDLHLSSVRDMELNMTRVLGAADAAVLQAMNGKHQDNDNMEAVTRMQIDVIAFALAADMARSATLQIGGGNDGTQYIIDGVKLPSYHQISHRIFSDGATGAPIPDAVTLHHKIDALHARHFKHLLDKLSSYTLPEGGTLLDSCAAVWCNSLSNGPPHSMKGVHYVIGGSAGGFFKTGIAVDAKGATNDKLLNSILTATGVRKAGGAPVDDFGDPSLQKGVFTDIHA